MLEFKVGDHLYRAKRMNAFQQFHVARRLAPLISEMMEMGDMLASIGEQEPNKLIVPFAGALSRITDEDCNYVLGMCLEMTQRQQGGNGSGVVWVDVWNPRAKRIMFEDLDSLPMMIEVVSKILQDNLTGFFGGGLPGAAATETQTLTLNSIG